MGFALVIWLECVRSARGFTCGDYVSGSSCVVLTLGSDSGMTSGFLLDPFGDMPWSILGIPFGTGLIPVGDRIGTRLGPDRDQIGTSLGPVWDQIGTSLGPVWDQFWTRPGPAWDQIGTRSGPDWGPFLVHVGSGAGAGPGPPAEQKRLKNHCLAPEALFPLLRCRRGTGP